MRIFALAVLLAIMQASAPIPRKTANPSNRTTKNVTKQSGSDKTPAQQAPSAVQPISTNPNQDTSHSPTSDDAPKPVIIRELPPVSVTKDRLDKLYIFFTGVLIVVGIVGVRAAYKTLGEMKAQREAMQGQLTAMQGQLAQMESSGKQTDRLIEKAGQQVGEMAQQRSVMDNQLSAMHGQLTAMQEQGRTMKESLVAAQAGIEAGINEKRARIKIEIGNVNLAVCNPEEGRLPTNMVTTTLLNYGQTVAFILDFRARFVRGDIGLEADFQNCKQLLYDESISSNARTPLLFGIILEPNGGLLSQDEILAIHKGEEFLHFYAFVDYEDVYGRYRTQTRHVYWKMRWGLHTEGQIMAQWEPIGERGENEDTEKPN
jgi:hypothetical protein